MNLKEGFAVIIDTNDYAGNFEREMTAFCTGIVGECEVGEEYIDHKIGELFDEAIQQVSDDNGCYRPCEAVFYNGECSSVAIYFNEAPTHELTEIIKERAHLFNDVRKESNWYKDSNIKILGFRQVKVSSKSEEVSL